jgi:hypothetical protein
MSSEQLLVRSLNGTIIADNSSNNTKPIKTVYSTIMGDEDMNASALRQILIWLPIGLIFVLYFTVMSLVDMPIQKNSILYAKYGTSKQMQS